MLSKDGKYLLISWFCLFSHYNQFTLLQVAELWGVGQVHRRLGDSPGQVLEHGSGPRPHKVYSRVHLEAPLHQHRLDRVCHLECRGPDLPGWGGWLCLCLLLLVGLFSINGCLYRWTRFLHSDATGLVDKKSVTSLQTRMLDCLQHYAATRYPREPRRYGRLLLRLPSLRMISARAAEMFLSLSLEGNVKMNALVLEMMDKVWRRWTDYFTNTGRVHLMMCSMCWGFF